jgi:hypothetical protein
MVRFLAMLAVAAAIVVIFWPLFRKLDPAQLRAEAAPPSRGGTIFFALAVTLALTFFFSAVLWYVGR